MMNEQYLLAEETCGTWREDQANADLLRKEVSRTTLDLDRRM